MEKRLGKVTRGLLKALYGGIRHGLGVPPGTCRFTPSCSSYARESFSKKPFFMALTMTLWRVMRCNPLCRGGWDPPERKGRIS